MNEYEKIDDLVKKSQAGDNKAFKELLLQYKGLIVNTAETYFNRNEYSWRNWIRVLQSIFYVYLRDYDSNRSVYFSEYISSKLKGWAFAEVKKANLFSKRVVFSDSATSSYFTRGNKFCVFSLRKELSKILSPNNFKILNLYYYGGYTWEEVSKILGLNRTSVYRRRKRIKEILRDKARTFI